MFNNELMQLFCQKFHIELLDERQQLQFVKSVTSYLQHTRNEDLKGRTYKFLEEKIAAFINICEIIGLTYPEMAKIIEEFPNILNIIEEFYYKYLILGVLENEENTLRKSKLVNKPRDYVVSIKQIYARYKLICEAGYNVLSWNALVHASKNEFASIFVTGSYKKPYQLFADKASALKWLENVDPSEIDYDSFKSLNANKEFVVQYEKRNKGLK